MKNKGSKGSKKGAAQGLIDIADAYVAPAFEDVRKDIAGFAGTDETSSILRDIARQIDDGSIGSEPALIEPLPDDTAPTSDAVGEGEENGADDGAVLDAAADDPWTADNDIPAVAEDTGDQSLPEFEQAATMPDLPDPDDEMPGFEEEDEEIVEPGHGDLDDIEDDESVFEDENVDILGDLPAAEDVEDNGALFAEREPDLVDEDTASGEEHGASETGDTDGPSADNPSNPDEDEDFSTELGPELRVSASGRLTHQDDVTSDVGNERVDPDGEVGDASPDAFAAEPVNDLESDVDSWSDVIDGEEDIPESVEETVWSSETDDPGSDQSATDAPRPAWQDIYENPPARRAGQDRVRSDSGDDSDQDEIRLSDNGQDNTGEDDSNIDHEPDEDEAASENLVASQTLAGSGDGQGGGRSGSGLFLASLAAALVVGGAGWAWINRDSLPALASIPGISQIVGDPEAGNPPSTVENQQETAMAGPDGEASADRVNPPLDVDGESTKAEPNESSEQGDGAASGGVPSVPENSAGVDGIDGETVEQPFSSTGDGDEGPDLQSPSTDAANLARGADEQSRAVPGSQADFDLLAGLLDDEADGGPGVPVDESDAGAEANTAQSEANSAQAEDLAQLKSEIEQLKSAMERANALAEDAGRQARGMSAVLATISQMAEQSEANNAHMVELAGRIARLEQNDPGTLARQTANDAVDSSFARIEGRIDKLSADIGIIARMAVQGGRGGNLPQMNSASASAPQQGRASPRVADSPQQAAQQAVPPSKTFTISSGDGGKIGRVRQGDFVEGYGYVLEVRPVAGGGRMVVMENGTVFVE